MSKINKVTLRWFGRVKQMYQDRSVRRVIRECGWQKKPGISEEVRSSELKCLSRVRIIG